MIKPTKKQIYVIVGIIFTIFLGYLTFGRSDSSSYDYVEVKRGDVIQEVSVTGKVRPVESADLAFQRSGRVSQIYVEVGDRIIKNQILVKLDNSELLAQLAGAEANLKIQVAKLDELKIGTRPEEIQIQEVNVANAKIALEDYKETLLNYLSDAFTKSDDAIRNKVDQFFNNSKSSNPTLSFVLADGQLKNDIEWGRYSIEIILNDWKFAVDNLVNTDNLDSITTIFNSNLNSVKLLLDKIASGVNSLTVSASLSQTTIDTYKSSVSTARTNVNLAISNLSSAYQGYRSAKSSLDLQENQLILKKAGAVPEQVVAQEAQVEKMKADINTYNAQITQTILRSPIGGLLTRQEAKMGQIVSANSIIASIISDDQYEIEVNVPEADIAKINIENYAKITLDAFGSGVIFDAHVVAINPAETLIEGIATYKTTLQFDKKEELIKSGMTANIDILAQKQEGVLFIPQRSLITKNGNRFVWVDVGQKMPEERLVEVGLKGSDGNFEIISGLKEGDKIVSSPSL